MKQLMGTDRRSLFKSSGKSKESRASGRLNKEAPAPRYAAIVNGELVNFYQRKVSLLTGQVVGAEALVRWRHPIDGTVFPDQFIDVAETHGLIGDLTRTDSALRREGP